MPSSMLSPTVAQRVMDAGLSTGADFVEIFLEEAFSSQLKYINQAPSKSLVGTNRGAGIRLLFGTEQIYVSTSDLSEASLIKAARTAAAAHAESSFKSKIAKSQPPLLARFDLIHKYGARAWDSSREKKWQLLKRLDASARSQSHFVTQVMGYLNEKNQKIEIFNSEGLWVQDERCYTRIGLEAHIEKNGQKQAAHDRCGMLTTLEALEKIDLEAMAKKTVTRAEVLIEADFAPAGEMPVVIDGGFGGVIFHEACGHGLETTSVAPGASVFCGKLNTQIANPCVTAIDDGTVVNAWGSLHVDDEGMATQKTTLIEKGILKSYIVDRVGALQTGYQRTGSGRRESYKYAPASRMRNTYIAPGTSSLEKMIGDVEHGLYAKVMGGGSVSPGTGEYNFGVVEAYLIKNGKVTKPVKGAALIGRGIDTLAKIEQVGSTLTMEDGMCGSVSGQIPTTVGQPPILVSKILVGGRN